jgi:hypothetical protein
MSQPPRASRATSTSRYSVRSEGLARSDPESPDYLGTYTPPPPYRVRPDMAEEQVDRTVQHGASYPVCSANTRELAKRGVPDPHRGLMGKLADAILHFLGYHTLSDPFIWKLRD